MIVRIPHYRVNADKALTLARKDAALFEEIGHRNTMSDVERAKSYRISLVRIREGKMTFAVWCRAVGGAS